jgi:hypothetical protein
MPANHIQLIAACLAMVLLVSAVRAAVLVLRVRGTQQSGVQPRTPAESSVAAHRADGQAADNFRNLFEVPVLFFALAAIALATGHVPEWLVVCSWVYVGLRVLHSFIHCTYDAVRHRLAVFAASSVLLAGMWIAYYVAVASIGRT